MSIVAIIPARYDSSRFPGKPLADIKGKSMIQLVFEQCAQLEFIDKVIIATDDERIFNHAQSFGASVMMTAASHRNGTERIAEVVKSLPIGYDAVLNVQGDEPFVHAEQLKLLCDLIQNPQFNIATLAKEITETHELESSNTVKVVFNKANKALYFSRFAIPFQRNREVGAKHFKHIGMYAFKANILDQLVNLPASTLEMSESLEQLRWLDHGFDIQVGITAFDSFGIDTPEDLILALKRLV